MATRTFLLVGAALSLCVGTAACDSGSTTDNNMFGDGTDTNSNDDGMTDDGADSSGGGGGGEDDVPIDSANMIDNLEDGDDVIIDSGGRVGAWYTYNDESAGGMQTPAGDEFDPSQGGAGGSSFAATMTGSGFTEWGAGMGFDLNNPGDDSGGAGVKGTWDASGFTGIAFRARGNVPMRLSVVTSAVVPVEFGGDCTPSEEEGQMCDDAHGRVFTLSDEWTQYLVPFDQATQGGWGLPADFDPAQLTGLQFAVEAGLDFEVSVDDIGFY